MKTVYFVWYNWFEHNYGELKERKNLDGIFQKIEDAKNHILKQNYPDDYEIEVYEYYEGNTKEKS